MGKDEKPTAEPEAAPAAPAKPVKAAKPKAPAKPKAAPQPKPAKEPVKVDSDEAVEKLAASLDIDGMLTGGRPVPGSGIDEDDLAGGSPIDEPALRLKVARYQLAQ